MDLLGQPLREVDLAVVDLEMTGLDTGRDEICEIAIIHVRGGVVRSRWSSLVRPRVQMSPGAIAVCGLTDGMLSSAPRIDELAQEIVDRLAGKVFVAHNAPFDLGYLHRDLARAGRPLDPPVSLDTLLMARRLFAFRRNHLGALAESFGVSQPDAHRAMVDAETARGVLHAMMEVLDPSGHITLGDLNMLLGALAPNSPLRLRQERTIRDAYRRPQTLWIDYQSTSEPRSGTIHREVAVWALNLPYVQGWCFLREGERVFRLDRMLSVEGGERPYEVPDDLALRI